MDNLLSKHQVAEVLAVSKKTVDRMERRGELPKRIPLGPNLVRWRQSEIEAFINTRPRGMCAYVSSPSPA